MKQALSTLALAGLLAGGPLHAQDTARAAAPGAATTAPLALDGSRLRPRGALYDVLVTSDSGTQHVGWHTVWVHDALFAGRTAWEVLERRESHAPWVVRVTRDSSILSRDQLHALRWEASAGDAKLMAAFANDSVYGGATSPEARVTFTVPAPPPVVTGEGALDALLQAAPLAAGWSARASLLVPDLSGASVHPLHLEVLRNETIRVPAGEFDAWVVLATAPGAERTLWVDRRTQLVLRALEQPAHMQGRQVERVLVGGY